MKNIHNCLYFIPYKEFTIKSLSLSIFSCYCLALKIIYLLGGGGLSGELKEFFNYINFCVKGS